MTKKIRRFFKDCEIVGGPNGIYFCLNEKGLPTGEAFIEMESQDDIDKALDKHKEEMGRRWGGGKGMEVEVWDVGVGLGRGKVWEFGWV